MRMIWRGLAIGLMWRATWSRSSATSGASSASPSSCGLLQRDERDDRLARELVGGAHDRRLGDGGVADERVLDLGGREAVPRDVHHVVDAAEQPQVAVLVALRAVAGEVAPRGTASSRCR